MWRPAMEKFGDSLREEIDGRPVVDRETLIIDAYYMPTAAHELIAAGVTWSRWEPQIMTDQVLVVGATNIPPRLPEGVRRAINGR